jgi:hypothetical protein
MLILKPNCECCDRDLPATSSEARICTIECTFCATCAATVFAGVCPNCNGNLVERPIRPPAMPAKYPAATERHLRQQPCGRMIGAGRSVQGAHDMMG